jgi:hypothetical protein
VTAGATPGERTVGGVAFAFVPPTHRTADIEIAAALVGALLLTALLLAPVELLAPWVGECHFHELTGWPCMTCGITRALVALSRGEVLVALRMNPLLIGAVLAAFAYTPLAWVMWLRRWPRPRIALRTGRARWTAALAAIGLLLANWAFLIIDGR